MATTNNPDAEFRRAMIYDPADGGGVFVFLFRSLSDGPCDADYWCEDAAAAERYATEALGVNTADWQPIADPRPGCQDDRIAAVRWVRDDGRTPHGRFELLPE